jgi:hypothetical protein
MRKFSEIDASRFLRASELTLGQRYAVVITGVSEEQVGPDKEWKVILTLAHAEGGAWKDYIPNKSARDVLAQVSDDPAKLVGVRLTLWAEPNQYMDKPGIKIALAAAQPLKAAGNGQRKPAAPPAADAGAALNDDIPF